jgi:hypothetical protein
VKYHVTKARRVLMLHTEYAAVTVRGKLLLYSVSSGGRHNMDRTGWVWDRNLTIRHRTEAAPHEVLHALSYCLMAMNFQVPSKARDLLMA